jgi:hypothetical protein
MHWRLLAWESIIEKGFDPRIRFRYGPWWRFAQWRCFMFIRGPSVVIAPFDCYKLAGLVLSCITAVAKVRF